MLTRKLAGKKRHRNHSRRNRPLLTPSFERLERRLALDAASAVAVECELDESIDQQAAFESTDTDSQSSNDCVDPAAADVDADGNVTPNDARVVIDALNDLSDEELATGQLSVGDVSGNGEVTAADALMILNDATLGGEGEFGSFAEGESSGPSDVSALLGQMLEFVTEEVSQNIPPAPAQNGSSLQLFESGLVAPEVAEQLSRDNQASVRSNFDLPDDAFSPRSSSRPNHAGLPRPSMTDSAVDTPEDVSDTNSTELSIASTANSSESTDQRLRSAGVIDERPKRSGRSQAHRPDVESAKFSRDFRSNIDFGRESPLEPQPEAHRNPVNADEALMSYLQNSEWALAPVVAGLAYAVTRSVDQKREAPEPKQMYIASRRRLHRLPTID